MALFYSSARPGRFGTEQTPWSSHSAVPPSEKTSSDKEVNLMFKFKTRDFDEIEITPPSSPSLKEKLEEIIDESQKWNAVVESLDQETGTYRILLQGTLRDSSSE
jgi:hypothetical protein